MTYHEDTPDELSRIMHAKLIGQNRNALTPSIETVADEMSMSGSTVYAWLEGRNPMTYPIFRRMYQIIAAHEGHGPVEALRYIVSCDPNYTLQRVPETKTDGSIMDEVGDAVIALGNASETLIKSFASGDIDRHERSYCEDAISRIEDVIARMKNELAAAVKS